MRGAIYRLGWRVKDFGERVFCAAIANAGKRIIYAALDMGGRP
jgi:hypothetical protein